MDLKDPIAAYTADGNIEVHSVVEWLTSNGVNAYAVEDNSGVSLFAFGTISQFHKPQVFIERSDTIRVAELLRQFEAKKESRLTKRDEGPPITSKCEECGESSEFPASQNGSVQNCPKCQTFMDVGIMDWPYDSDVGDADT